MRAFSALVMGALLLMSGCGGDGDDGEVAPLVAPVTDATPPPTTATPLTDSPTASTEREPTTTEAVTTTQAVTTTAPATTTTVPGSVNALTILASIAVTNERGNGYDRSLFAYPADLDGDGCDTRSEVLERDSLTPVQRDSSGCVVGGEWQSFYDGVTASNPAAMTVDHVVSLKEAWDSGARAWDQSWRVAFANDLDDPRTLRLTTAELNQAKGHADPSNWVPPDEADVCRYITDWIAIKARWGLSMDESEHGRIGNLLERVCVGAVVAPWPDPPPPPPPTPTTSPTTTAPALPPSTTQPAAPAPPPVRPVIPQQPSNCDSSYPTVCIPPAPPDLDCGDISHRRFHVVPPDPHNFDGDHDGVGCES